MSEQPRRILCVTSSDIGTDARVLRQLDALAGLAEVTTLGYGAEPAGVAEHLEIDPNLAPLPGPVRLALRRHDAAELRSPAAREALRLVGDRRFDVVVANAVTTLPLAHRVARGAPVVADLHDWDPEEHTNVRSWRLLVKPFVEHLCVKYLPKAAALTVVNDSIGAMYETHFGVRTHTVRNAVEYRELAPGEVADGRIRLVHSGTAVPGRNVDALIEAVRGLDERFTLDLYLGPGRDLDRLRRLADRGPRVTLHPPVPADRLVDTLNAYDVGVHGLPRLTPNHWLTLPGTFFDFVQARLGVVFATAPETDRLITEHDLGAVAPDASAQALHDTLAELTTERVRQMKANAGQAAKALSSAEDAAVTRAVVARLLSPQ
jgi:glycosyltransferase involved in cell wall biosynthesis